MSDFTLNAIILPALRYVIKEKSNFLGIQVQISASLRRNLSLLQISKSLLMTIADFAQSKGLSYRLTVDFHSRY